MQQHTIKMLNGSNIRVLMSASFTTDPTIVLDQVKVSVLQINIIVSKSMTDHRKSMPG